MSARPTALATTPWPRLMKQHPPRMMGRHLAPRELKLPFPAPYAAPVHPWKQVICPQAQCL